MSRRPVGTESNLRCFGMLPFLTGGFITDIAVNFAGETWRSLQSPGTKGLFVPPWPQRGLWARGSQFSKCVWYQPPPRPRREQKLLVSTQLHFSGKTESTTSVQLAELYLVSSIPDFLTCYFSDSHRQYHYDKVTYINAWLMWRSKKARSAMLCSFKSFSLSYNSRTKQSR